MTGQTPGDVQAAVVEVLAAHYSVGGFAPRAGWATDVDKLGHWACSCGAYGDVWRGERVVAHHRTHVAAALAAAGLLATTPTEGRDDSAVVERVRAEHAMVADWTCACGEDFFGGTAAYSDLAHHQHQEGRIRAALDAPTAPTDHEERP